MLALALVAAVARADATLPVPPTRLGRCAAAIEQARRTLGERYALIADAEVVERDNGVTLRFQDGWCMHHTSGEVAVWPRPGRDHAWRRRPLAHGYTAERRARGLLATIIYYDHNESESSGGVDGLDDALWAAFRPAIDGCLPGRE